jgi:hypothetical protein
MKRTILLLTGMLLLGQMLCAEEKITVKEYPLTAMQKQNRSIVKLASEELNKELPKKIDKYTTLMKIEGKGETLLYTFEINTGSKSDEAVRKEDRTRMQRAVTNGVCKSSKRFLDAYINIEYVYMSAKSKKELFRFDIKRADCEYFD